MGWLAWLRSWFTPKPKAPVIVVAPGGARIVPPGAGSTNAPTVTTQAVSSITTTTATGNGNVTSDGNSPITERGVCWSTSINPTTSDSKATSAGTTGAFTASITGLSASTAYHVRAYAINAIATSYGADVTFTASSTLYPNEPGGNTIIAETDDTQLPINGTTSGNSHVLNGNATLVSGTSWSLATLSSDGVTACPTGQTKAIKLTLPTGTVPGNPPTGGAGFYLWDNLIAAGTPPQNGPAANEYSSIYVSLWVNLWGDGSGNFEVPAAGLWKLMYLGCTYNNLNDTGGFGQLEYMMLGVTKTTHAGAPDTYTQFTPAIYTQNFTNQDQVQNENTGTKMNVKSWHQLELLMTTGTDSNADGHCDIYIDNVRVVHYTNTQILKASTTYAGAPGNAGYDCYAWTPVWGGGGGANKSRNDYVYYGHAYMSGVKLRNRA